MQKKIIIIGAGGHGKVVADAVLSNGKFILAGFADDNVTISSEVYLSYKVLCKIDNSEIQRYADGFIVAIGNNEIRKSKYEMLKTKMDPVTVIHSFTHIAGDVILGSGTMILAGAVINPSVKIGENCIINSMSFIDHDTTIGSHSHVGQCAIVGSGNKSEELSDIKQGENKKSRFH